LYNSPYRLRGRRGRAENVRANPPGSGCTFATPVSGVGGGVSPPPINSFTYAYDLVGQCTSETALDHQRAFSYDAQRQLTQSTTTANGVQTAMPQYTYDGIGNRLTSAVNDSNGAQSSVSV
jgi:YD repeat-containing protein